MSETYVDLLMSIPHWGFEITGEVLTALVVYPIFRVVEKKWKDRFHAELDTCHDVAHSVFVEVEETDFAEVDALARAKWDRYWNDMHRARWDAL